jgi:signal transduction histidine kinase
MKNILTISLLFIVMLPFSNAQLSDKTVEELKNSLSQIENDSVYIMTIWDIAQGYRFSNIDSCMRYLKITEDFARDRNVYPLLNSVLSSKGIILLETGKIPEALELQFEVLKLAEETGDLNSESLAKNQIGNIFMELADYKNAIEYYNLSKDVFEKIGNRIMVYNELSNIGNVFEKMQEPDSALYYQNFIYKAYEAGELDEQHPVPEIMFRMGNAHKLKGNYDQAIHFYQSGIQKSFVSNDLRNRTMCYIFLSKLYNEINERDSSYKYAIEAFNSATQVAFKKGIYESSLIISEQAGKIEDYEQAFKFLSLATEQSDSLSGIKRVQELQKIILNEQERKKEIEEKLLEDQNKRKQMAFILGLSGLLLFSFVLLWSYRQKVKSNKKLNLTLTNLKATQAQLVQSEKMASLGELTAGIAHEIQNPLNFVNNFSEVNAELLDEMKDELDQGEVEEAIEIVQDILQNNEKIIHHGKRADSIVKGMLEHSRTSSGEKVLTDINALTDEYLRLAFHGLRAKDNSFNAKMESTFDSNLPKVKVVPQDIGRVLLNVVSNAFQAVHEKSKQSIINYEPTVKIITKFRGKDSSSGAGGSEGKTTHIQISVTDNGHGIPSEIADKIFQPFFTTKPTGEGTGLGLSLSYDIIKAHGGEISVESEGGKGTEFIITLPV